MSFNYNEVICASCETKLKYNFRCLCAKTYFGSTNEIICYEPETQYALLTYGFGPDSYLYVNSRTQYITIKNYSFINKNKEDIMKMIKISTLLG